jgi:phosphate starvation-inducible PhoH-like protein
MLKQTLTVEDPEHIRLLQGANDRYLRRVRDTFGLRARARGHRITLEGDDAEVKRGMHVLQDLLRKVERRHRLSEDDVSQALRHAREESGPQSLPRPVDEEIGFHLEHNRTVAPRTTGQKEYAEAIRRHDVVFGIGPAGTGKTYMAVAAALEYLHAGEVNRIVLVRPAVEAGERLGFLPGDFREKVNPYLRPLYDALQDMLPFGQLERYLQRGVIEILPLAYMRGRTLNAAYVILDEAQNTTPKQMKMFLTRLGHHARAVITGDMTQVDLAESDESGLAHAVRILAAVDGIAVVELNEMDIVRHRLVRDIVRAYDRAEQARRPADRQGTGARGSDGQNSRRPQHNE